LGERERARGGEHGGRGATTGKASGVARRAEEASGRRSDSK